MRLIFAAIPLMLLASPVQADVSTGKEFLSQARAVKAVKAKRQKAKMAKAKKPRNVFAAYADSLPKGNVSLAGVVEPLAAKAREAVDRCGAKVVSAVRPGARIPGGRVSNHAIGRAVDLRGNPSCLRSVFSGWPGGMSTDYASAPGGPHYHVSYNPGGMEWGRRFAHSGARRKTRHRYASAN